LENVIIQKNIIIDNEQINDNGVNFNIKNINLYHDGIYLFDISSIDVDLFLLYNSIQIDFIKPTKTFMELGAFKIENITAQYFILNPFEINFDIESEIGKMQGIVSLFKKKAIIKYIPNKKYKKYRQIVSKFKFIDGEYIYEYSF
jgi:hypothetical protein